MESKDILVCSYNDVHTLCRCLQEKLESSGIKFEYIAAVSRGGLLPGLILSHKMGLPLYPIMWSTRDHGQQTSYADIAEDLSNGLKIILVDDMNDSGRTFTEILDNWGDMANSDLVKQNTITAALYQRYSSQYKCQYVGEVINDDRWVKFPFEV
jgi:hypothetical protein